MNEKIKATIVALRSASAMAKKFENRPQCSYYDEDGDPFDAENEANWDGDQQIGFRD